MTQGVLKRSPWYTGEGVKPNWNYFHSALILGLLIIIVFYLTLSCLLSQTDMKVRQAHTFLIPLLTQCSAKTLPPLIPDLLFNGHQLYFKWF